MKYILLILAATLAIPTVSSAENIYHCRNASGQFVKCGGNTYKPKEKGWFSKLYDDFYDSSKCAEGYAKDIFGSCHQKHIPKRSAEDKEEYRMHEQMKQYERDRQAQIEQDILKYDCEPHFAWMDGVRYPMVPDSRCN